MKPERPKADPRGLFLVGPTASGKTAVAHELADRLGLPVLSADAMLVYRDMDIGTAKPPARELARYRYRGVDLASPREAFSVGRYLEAVREALQGADEPTWIVAGGTGLYIKALCGGLDLARPVSGASRSAAKALLEAGGLDALRRELERRAPGALAGLSDPENPRRVQRELERVLDGMPAAASAARPARPRLVGLARSTADLGARIAGRVTAMFDNGLVEEVAALRRRYGELSPTAGGAIGYREAAAVLDGRCTEAEARERVAVRTRQLAKRQMTWLRHQAEVAWIKADATAPPARIADAVQEMWREIGSAAITDG